MTDLVFLSPMAFTGGPLALHEAASAANMSGIAAGICYVRKRNGKYLNDNAQTISNNLSFWEYKKIDPRLSEIGCRIFKKIPKNCYFIVPEGMPELAIELLSLGCEKIFIWWLSVDNFPMSKINTLQTQFLLHKTIHLCQSHYAKSFLQGLGIQETHMLSDYTKLNDEKELLKDKERKIDISFLPNKSIGAENLIAKLNSIFNVVPLENMSPSQVYQTLRNSKIFIDFGNHPGKDRVPREAALCGAIPVIRKIGAATFQEDVPLPDSLLLDTKIFFNETEFMEKIMNILDNLEYNRKSIENYVRKIMSEEQIFHQEIQNLVSMIKNDGSF